MVYNYYVKIIKFMQRVEFVLKKKSKNRKYKPKEYEGKTNIVNLKEFEIGKARNPISFS